jgi:hypothetical protein
MCGVTDRVRGIHARLRLLIAAMAFLVPAAAGAQILQADLDGDGVRDQVFRGPQAADLCLRLSRTPQPRQLRLSQPVVRVAAADLDHDGDADIIATTTGTGFDFVINLGRGRFRAIHGSPFPLRGAARASICADRAGPPDDDFSDAPPASTTVTQRGVRGPSPAPLIGQAASSSPLRFLSRGLDPRGPPSVRT